MSNSDSKVGQVSLGLLLTVSNLVATAVTILLVSAIIFAPILYIVLMILGPMSAPVDPALQHKKDALVLGTSALEYVTFWFACMYYGARCSSNGQKGKAYLFAAGPIFGVVALLFLIPLNNYLVNLFL